MQPTYRAETTRPRLIEIRGFFWQICPFQETSPGFQDCMLLLWVEVHAEGALVPMEGVESPRSELIRIDILEHIQKYPRSVPSPVRSRPGQHFGRFGLQVHKLAYLQAAMGYR